MSASPDRASLQLAGMALRNGVLMLGPTSWAVAIRTGTDDGIEVTSGPRPASGERATRRIPFLRGPAALLNMVRVLPTIRRAQPRARLGMESPGVLLALAAGTVLSAHVRRRVRSAAVGEFVAGGLSLAMTMVTMRTGEVAHYHGAEHKAIGGYEQGIDPATAPRQHPRCGTQLALPMLAFTALATPAALVLAPRHPRTARNVGQLVGIAAATELFRAAQRRRPTRVTTLVQRAGTALQTHATTREPSAAQLDVAKAALAAVLERESHAASARS